MSKKLEYLFEEIHEKEKYLYYRIYLYFYRLFWRLIRLPGEVKRYIIAFFQRGYRGWANEDTWAFGYYIAKVCYQGLKHLKKYQNGLPTWTKDKTERQAKKEWNIIMNTMIDGFKAVIDLNEKCWRSKNFKKYMKKIDKGLAMFSKHFLSLWD